MEITEKRKATLINIAYYSVIVVLFYLFMKYAFGLVAPFIVALAIAVILQKPLRTISEKTKIKKNILGAVAVLLIISVVLSLIVLVGYRLFVEFKGFGEYIMSRLSDLPALIRSAEDWILARLTVLPDSLEKTVTDSVTGIVDRLLLASQTETPDMMQSVESGFDLSFLATPLGGLLSTAKQIPVVFAGVFMGIIACFFITCDYDKFRLLISENISREHEMAIVKTRRILGDILGKMLKSYATLIFITFCEVSIGLNIMKLIGVYDGGYILVISIITAIVDILPVLGTGTILIPWAIFNLFTGNIGLGIALVVLYVLITVIRQVIEPRLVAMNVGLHPAITLFGMYLGVQIFGFLGIFILPITFVLVKALNDEGIIHLWGMERKKEKQNK